MLTFKLSDGPCGRGLHTGPLVSVNVTEGPCHLLRVLLTLRQCLTPHSTRPGRFQRAHSVTRMGPTAQGFVLGRKLGICLLTASPPSCHSPRVENTCSAPQSFQKAPRQVGRGRHCPAPFPHTAHSLVWTRFARARPLSGAEASAPRVPVNGWRVAAVLPGQVHTQTCRRKAGQGRQSWATEHMS